MTLTPQSEAEGMKMLMLEEEMKLILTPTVAGETHLRLEMMVMKVVTPPMGNLMMTYLQETHILLEGHLTDMVETVGEEEEVVALAHLMEMEVVEVLEEIGQLTIDHPQPVGVEVVGLQLTG
jgi:hypothetical protein